MNRLKPNQVLESLLIAICVFTWKSDTEDSYNLFHISHNVPSSRAGLKKENN